MMQAGKDYGVRVVKPFQQFSEGFVMFPSAMYREKLLKGGWVEEVKPEVVKTSNQAKPTLKLR